MNSRFVFIGSMALGVAAAFAACSSSEGEGDDGAKPKSNQAKIEAFCDALCECEGACDAGDGDGDEGKTGVISGGSDGEEGCVSLLEDLLDAYQGCTADATADYYACLAEEGSCELGGVGGGDSGTETLLDEGCLDDYVKAYGECDEGGAGGAGGGGPLPSGSTVGPGTTVGTSGTGGSTPGCDAGEYDCGPNDFCLSLSGVCDGVVDCDNGNDEADCAAETCDDPDAPYDCGPGDFCLSLNGVCDGVEDCNNGADEVDCNLECTSDEAECADGECIPLDYVCDGVEDCSQGEDESDATCLD